MKISVVIPVYNAESYVEEAVNSALTQTQVGEVVLVEDGSTDNSLKVCQRLSSENSNIVLVQHPDGRNHGAATSRNLGILNVKYDYIAFLDADDFYLEDRFLISMQLFEADSSIDGVYEAIGTHFQDDQARIRWMTLSRATMTTMKRVVVSDNLLESLVYGENGFFHLDGLVVKKSIFNKTGFFDRTLRISQDTAMILKLAAVGKLVPGSLEIPVAMRRIHGANRITSAIESGIADKFRCQCAQTVMNWAIHENLPSKKQGAFLLFLLTSNASADGKHGLSLFRDSFKIGLKYWKAALSTSFIRLLFGKIIQKRKLLFSAFHER